MKEISMAVIPMTPKVPAEFIPYISGDTNTLPDTSHLKRRRVQKILEARRTYIRTLLICNPHKAYSLPDFETLMRAEILTYAKRELMRHVFDHWDQMMEEVYELRTLFEKELQRRQDEYFKRAAAGRPKKKFRYIQREAMHYAFKECTKNPEALGSIESACIGETRYGC